MIFTGALKRFYWGNLRYITGTFQALSDIFPRFFYVLIIYFPATFQLCLHYFSRIFQMQRAPLHLKSWPLKAGYAIGLSFC